MIIAMVSFFSCEQEDHQLFELQGTVRFGGISLEFAPMGSPQNRIAGNSTWEHIFPNSADLIFENLATGQRYTLAYNPNDFSVPYSITLPFGAYAYNSIVEGGVFSEYLPFEVAGELLLNSQSLEISLEAETDYGLITVKNKYVNNASVTDGETASELALCENDTYWYMYVKGETDATLMIKESFQGSTIIRELAILANRHYNYILKLAEGIASIKELAMAVFELEEEEILLGSSSKFFLHENGLTCMCPDTEPGEKGFINGVEYESVDNELLRKRRNERVGLSKLCTSLVTDMADLFDRNLLSSQFPLRIESWDVSNVTTMRRMFYRSIFNEPIGDWDVGNVTNMVMMFNETPFNQPIGRWDVGKVTAMDYMFFNSHFNQPIGDWNVSSVRSVENMFSEGQFNQPIGNWDVSSVISMKNMLDATPFNQPLENWNVSNVTNMRGMFGGTPFNQPIGNWDVGKVTNMIGMFSNTPFNQPIGDWNVSNVTGMWGMFSNTPFNQPIGYWDVSNVTDMKNMFNESLFNQPIENWNVRNVTSMASMFYSSPFNHPIDNWDVGNVANMSRMFLGTPFNQPLETWNVGKVTDMNGMFARSSFNQSISAWCVSNLPSEPLFFATDCPLTDANKPIWGTCPD